MVLVGLLLVALVLVVVGVVRASVGWLIASLVVSVVAAAVLLRSYWQNRARARVARSTPSAPPDAAVTQSAAPEPVRPPDTPVWVADGYPEYHVEGCAELADLTAEAVPYEQAVEDGFQPCVVCNPQRGVPPSDSRQVVVIDGFPDYHVGGCPVLTDHESVSIPVDQAVDDGFSPCAVCRPDAAAVSADVKSAKRGDVWVVDGYPDYHREACPTLAGLAAEAIPHVQAVEDGFAECALCTPSTPEAGEVWVVDGFPNYHRADCGELSGLPAEAIPREQAVEDGFAPCPVCRYEDRQVWVVDGHPDYHRTGCDRLPGLPAEPIPYQQAVEDGFVACAVCRPDDEAQPRAEPEVSDRER